MTGMRSNFIGGTWMPSASDAGIDVVNPATEAVIDRVPAGAAADVAAAARAARTAFAAWSVTPPAERARHLAAARDLLAERADTVAAAISADMGAPLAFARRVQVGTPLAVLGTFIDLLSGYDFGGDRVGNSLIVREPAGVAGAITPWNYPLHQIVAKVGAALAAGCTVVLKPAEVAPAAAYELADIFAATGLPPGVFNLVSGTGPVVGEAIAAHPDVDLVSFTGSTWAGRRVAEVAAAAPKRVTLELGCRSAPRKKPSRSPTGRPTGWPRASGRPTRSTPWRSPGGCARARSRSTAAPSTRPPRSAAGASPGTGASWAGPASRSSWSSSRSSSEPGLPGF
jgi:aldehyde dehydrogenase (NAD+)